MKRIGNAIGTAHTSLRSESFAMIGHVIERDAMWFWAVVVFMTAAPIAMLVWLTLH